MTLAEAWLLPIDVTIGIINLRAAQIEDAMRATGSGDEGSSVVDGPGGTKRWKFGKGAAGMDSLRQALRTGRP